MTNHLRPIKTHEVVISVMGMVVGLASVLYGIYWMGVQP